MGDSDLWRTDGSFRGIQDTGGKGTRGKGGSAPQFTRVIPKFLRKYHEPPAIQAKFMPPPMPDGEDDDDGELDEVQQAAMDAYLEKDKEKREKIAKAAGADDADGADAGDAGAETSKVTSEGGKKKANQAVAGVGATQPPKKKKRKRAEVAMLSNKKLLSFSMDDEE
uniref:DUF4604 domain-containing protein n=1 Tax=Globisporangium ultimum (strain ATCC 200006 / CBS 805.95 / DAOM BR144) TaxID=431595 RepID=K3WVL6_GLOUD